MMAEVGPGQLALFLTGIVVVILLLSARRKDTSDDLRDLPSGGAEQRQTEPDGDRLEPLGSRYPLTAAAKRQHAAQTCQPKQRRRPEPTERDVGRLLGEQLHEFEPMGEAESLLAFKNIAEQVIKQRERLSAEEDGGALEHWRTIEAATKTLLEQMPEALEMPLAKFAQMKPPLEADE